MICCWTSLLSVGQAWITATSSRSTSPTVPHGVPPAFETGLFPGESFDSSAPLGGTFTDGKLHHFASGRSFSHEGPFITGRRRVLRSCASWCGWLLCRILCRFFAQMQIYCAGFCAALERRYFSCSSSSSLTNSLKSSRSRRGSSSTSDCSFFKPLSVSNRPSIAV